MGGRRVIERVAGSGDAWLFSRQLTAPKGVPKRSASHVYVTMIVCCLAPDSLYLHVPLDQLGSTTSVQTSEEVFCAILHHIKRHLLGTQTPRSSAKQVDHPNVCISLHFGPHAETNGVKFEPPEIREILCGVDTHSLLPVDF